MEAQERHIANDDPDSHWTLVRVGARALMPKLGEGSRSTELETDVMQRVFANYARAIIQFKKAYLEDAVQQILKVWKLDTGAHTQARKAYDSVEKSLQTDPKAWPTKVLRRNVLSRLVRFALDQVLRLYGYHIIAWTAPKLNIATSPDAPNVLPVWLNQDYFVIVTLPDSRLKQIGGEISGLGGPRPAAGKHLVRPGHSISNEYIEEQYGTLGVIMEAVHLDAAPEAPNPIYVALTCAHVAKIATTTYEKDNRRSPALRMIPNLSLQADSSVRSFQRDCAFLRVQENDTKQFSMGFYEYTHRGLLSEHTLKNVQVDCHHYNRDPSNGFAFDPTSASRRDYIEQAMLDGPVIVYKLGATTGYTAGILIAIQDDVVPHCDYLDGYPMDPLARHHDEWIGLVRWDWPNKPFAKPGDSGSLVFAGSERAIIPLGIHIASSNAMDETSVFISLDTFCLQARKREGLALTFPNRNIPWWVKLVGLSRAKFNRGNRYPALKESDPIKWAVRTRQWAMFESVILDDGTECGSEDPYGCTLLSYLSEMKDHKLTDRLREKLKRSAASGVEKVDL